LRKRDEKEEVKRIAKAAKEQGRTNRDKDMDFFAVYYQAKFPNFTFKKLLSAPNHPECILKLFGNNAERLKVI
jgi:hypothetical protein